MFSRNEAFCILSMSVAAKVSILGQDYRRILLLNFSGEIDFAFVRTFEVAKQCPPIRLILWDVHLRWNSVSKLPERTSVLTTAVTGQ